MQEIYEIIALYAPTVLTLLGVLMSYVKIFVGIKQSHSTLLNDPKMIALKDELETTKNEMSLMRSQVNEMVRRQGELINELSKVEKYDNRENN